MVKTGQKATLGVKRWEQVIKGVDKRRVKLREQASMLEAKRKLGQHIDEEEQREFMQQSLMLA